MYLFVTLLDNLKDSCIKIIIKLLTGTYIQYQIIFYEITDIICMTNNSQERKKELEVYMGAKLLCTFEINCVLIQISLL